MSNIHEIVLSDENLARFSRTDHCKVFLRLIVDHFSFLLPSFLRVDQNSRDVQIFVPFLADDPWLAEAAVNELSKLAKNVPHLSTIIFPASSKSDQTHTMLFQQLNSSGMRVTPIRLLKNKVDLHDSSISNNGENTSISFSFRDIDIQHIRKELKDGKTIVFIDDTRRTGRTEQAIIKLLREHFPNIDRLFGTQILFIYFLSEVGYLGTETNDLPHYVHSAFKIPRIEIIS